MVAPTHPGVETREQFATLQTAQVAVSNFYLKLRSRQQMKHVNNTVIWWSCSQTKSEWATGNTKWGPLGAHGLNLGFNIVTSVMFHFLDSLFSFIFLVLYCAYVLLLCNPIPCSVGDHVITQPSALWAPKIFLSQMFFIASMPDYIFSVGLPLPAPRAVLSIFPTINTCYSDMGYRLFLASTYMTRETGWIDPRAILVIQQRIILVMVVYEKKRAICRFL